MLLHLQVFTEEMVDTAALLVHRAFELGYAYYECISEMTDEVRLWVTQWSASLRRQTG